MRNLEAFRRPAAAALVAMCACAAIGAAQETQAPTIPPLVVTVRVIDSTGLAIEGADAAVLVGLSESKASGATDASGRVSLTVTQPQGDYQLVIRKIGYNRTDQFFHGRSGRMTFDVVMRRTTQTLATVKVTAQEDLKRKSYFIDADEIAKHADELLDASDILKKLKPDMICGRSCFPLGAVAATTRNPVRACPSLTMQPRRRCPVDNTPPSLSSNVWVNGVWIRTIVSDTACQMGRRGMLAGLSPGSMQVLCEIRPEHIEEMSYADEFNTTVGKNHSDSALFIVLKAGIAYQPGAMSYVVSESPFAERTTKDTTRLVGDSASGHESAAVRDSAATLPTYRYRLLGVFDALSGEPVDSARVTDSKTGTYVSTTSTGTVSLIFLPEGESLLHITKAGYEDLDLAVAIGAASTTPVTLLMQKKPSGT